MSNRRIPIWLWVLCAVFALPRDPCLGQQVLTPAGDGEDPSAEVALGDSYAAGKGIAKDLSAAVNLYHKAAEKGFAAGQYKLGSMYLNGSGVLKDTAEGARWYRKAADQGFVDAEIVCGR